MEADSTPVGKRAGHTDPSADQTHYKVLSAGQMGASTSEVGDLVVSYL